VPAHAFGVDALMTVTAGDDGELAGKTVRDFIRADHLGHGSFCEVVRCCDNATGRQYAMKSVVKRHGPQDQAITMEVHCLRERLRGSPWVAALLLEEDRPAEWVGIFELCEGGELWEYVKHSGCCVPGEAAVFVTQMVHALAAVHDAGIVHRDVKCENFMLTGDRRLKLIDFGTARDTQHPEVQTMKLGPQYDHHVGTPNFMAPEAVHGKANDRKSDLWSLGCTAYQLVTGFPPFGAVTPFLSLHKAQTGNLWLPSRGVEATELDLIRRLVVVDPASRLGASTAGGDGGAATRQVLTHAFLRGAAEKAPPDTVLADVLRRVGRACYAEVEAQLAESNPAEAHAGEPAFLLMGRGFTAAGAAKPFEATERLLRDLAAEYGDGGHEGVEVAALFRMAHDAAALVEEANEPGSFARRMYDVAPSEVMLSRETLMALGRFAEMAEQAVQEAQEQPGFGVGSGSDSDESEKEKEAEEEEEESPPAARGGANQARRCCGFLRR